MPGIQIGNQIDMNGFKVTEMAPGTAGTDAVNLDQLTAGAPQGYAADIGDGVSPDYLVTHNLGTLDVIVQVYELATNHNVWVDVHRDNTIDIIVTFGAPIAVNSHRVLVIPVPAP